MGTFEDKRLFYQQFYDKNSALIQNYVIVSFSMRRLSHKKQK